MRLYQAGLASPFKRLMTERGNTDSSIRMRGERMAERRLTEKSREAIVRILTHNGADWIAVFGSYARGDAGAASDIDILVRFARKKSLFQLVRIEDELRRALGRDVDLVTENAVSPYLADAIYRDAVVIYDAGGPCISPPHP